MIPFIERDFKVYLIQPLRFQSGKVSDHGLVVYCLLSQHLLPREPTPSWAPDSTWIIEKMVAESEGSTGNTRVGKGI